MNTGLVDYLARAVNSVTGVGYVGSYQDSSHVQSGRVTSLSQTSRVHVRNIRNTIRYASVCFFFQVIVFDTINFRSGQVSWSCGVEMVLLQVCSGLAGAFRFRSCDGPILIKSGQ